VRTRVDAEAARRDGDGEKEREEANRKKGEFIEDDQLDAEGDLDDEL